MKRIVFIWIVAVMLGLAACQLLPPEDSPHMVELATEPTVTGDLVQKTTVSTHQ
jgi:hypothetical protein